MRRVPERVTVRERSDGQVQTHGSREAVELLKRNVRMLPALDSPDEGMVHRRRPPHLPLAQAGGEARGADLESQCRPHGPRPTGRPVDRALSRSHDAAVSRVSLSWRLPGSRRPDSRRRGTWGATHPKRRSQVAASVDWRPSSTIRPLPPGSMVVWGSTEAIQPSRSSRLVAWGLWRPKVGLPQHQGIEADPSVAGRPPR